MSRVETIGDATLYLGDCLYVLDEIAAGSVNSCVTDPPYHLTAGKAGGTGIASLNENSPAGRARVTTGFMGKAWDGGDLAFKPELWAKVFRALKPGAHLVAFGGTRTYHRMACAIEDAGFEIRDQLAWVYGSGFPKSLDVSKAIDRAAGAERTEVVGIKPGHEDFANRSTRGHIDFKDATDGFDRPWMHDDEARARYHQQLAPATDAARQWQGWGTALKPSWEPIVLARKPLVGTVAANVLAHGTGALNIDGCRIETNEGLNGGAYREGEASAERTYSEKGGTNFAMKPGMRRGRAPMPGDERQGAALGMFQDGKTVGVEFKQPPGRWPANLVHDGSEEVVAAFPDVHGAGVACENKWSRSENVNVYGKANEGMTGARIGDSGSAARFFYSAKADADDRLGSKHPTVKPVDLMQWLVRLVTPPGGLILDPFAGTGTTGDAAIREGFRAILIERETEYQEDIRRRLRLVLAGPVERKHESIKARGKTENAGPLFADREPKGFDL